MDSNNYVAPFENGYIVVINGQFMGQDGKPASYPHIFPTQAAAESAYNAFGGPGGSTGGTGSTSPAPSTQPTYGVGAGPSAGGQTVNVGDYQNAALQTQLQIAAWQDAYNKSRLALDAILGYASQTGFIDPSMINMFLTESGAGTNGAMYNTKNGPKTVQQMRDEIVDASGGMPEWQNASDDEIINKYGEMMGEPVIPMEGGNSGQQYTFAGAAQASHGWALGDTLGGLGLTPEQMPTYDAVQGKTPTLAMQEIMADPKALIQTLMMTGMTKDQIAAYLESSPVVQQLLNNAYGAGYNAPAQPSASPPAVTNPPIDGTVPPPNAVPLVPPNPNGYTAQGGYTTQSSAGTQPGTTAGTSTGNYWDQPGFQFIEGHKLPIRDTLNMLNMQDPMLGAYMSMADYAGYNPENWWGQFQSVLPKGSKNPLTRFI
jgi:hypothetical protein